MSEKDDLLLLDFSGAIEKILEGKRVSRKEWNDKRTYCLLQNDILHIHKAGEAEKDIHPWIINNGDLGGLDWYVV